VGYIPSFILGKIRHVHGPVCLGLTPYTWSLILVGTLLALAFFSEENA
jgi:hypothetical protein